MKPVHSITSIDLGSCLLTSPPTISYLTNPRENIVDVVLLSATFIRKMLQDTMVKIQ